MSGNILGQTLLNQFRIDAFIASGGMGAVYRVWDIKRSAPLAMKVLHADLAEDPAAFRRFEREARALQELAHPNIVPFYGLYQTGDISFLVEAFINGPTLKDIQRMRQGKPFSVIESLILLKALCAALGYAHANNVVHCDVKPGNVMLDPGGNIYLADFGIARYTEGTTTTLAAAGTPAYMAPEQIRAQRVTAAADIYALGVVLFELLTGQRPFRGGEPGSERGGTTANDRIRWAHVNLDPVDPRGINPTIPPALAQVILTALQKSPERRFNSTLQLFTSAASAAGISPSQLPDRLPGILPEQGNAAPPVLQPQADLYRQAFPAQTPIPPPPSIPQARLDHQKVPQKRSGWLVIGGAAAVLILIIFFMLSNRNPGELPASTQEVARATLASTAPAGAAGSSSEDSPTPQPELPAPTITPLPSPTATILQPTKPSFITAANPKDNASLVFVGAGEFIMGSSPETDPYFYGAEQPPHPVYLDDFWIYRTEVTNAQYQACVQVKGCPMPSGYGSKTRQDYYQSPGFQSYPVVNVSWRDAAAYCRWAGGRLPTEAEWEKAGRGTDRRLYPWGDQNPANNLANINSRDTAAVGSYPEGASPYGALDMAGNVIEWVFDYFQATYYQISPYENPRGPSSGSTRVYRSGSFQNDASAVRVVMRGSRSETTAQVDIGFRCAMDDVPAAAATPIPATDSSQPSGKIVFVCQVDKNDQHDQLCLINADGSGFRRLTTDTNIDHNYPSFSPDGQSIVYVSNSSGVYEIYELELSTGRETQRSFSGIDLAAPEISPDGRSIVFTRVASNGNGIWVMERDGNRARQVYGPPDGFGWDPVWSPDGAEILFASGTLENARLYHIPASGGFPDLITDLSGLRGRSDWSPDGETIATYAGPSWLREIYLLNVDGSNARKITNGGNNLAPGFSPDGLWITFTSYLDRYRDDNGCEIYIMRLDGSDVRRMTDNEYCDWQPRWGP